MDVAEKYAGQGATFVAVCDARSDFAAMKAKIPAENVFYAVAQDAPPVKVATGEDVEPAPAESEPKPAVGEAPSTAAKPAAAVSAIGRFASSLGVRFQPITVVVDRAGRVRAAGVSLDKLESVLNALLAEPMPDLPAPVEAGEPVETGQPAETGQPEAGKAESKAREGVNGGQL